MGGVRGKWNKSSEVMVMRGGKGICGQWCESWESTVGPQGNVAPRRATLVSRETRYRNEGVL